MRNTALSSLKWMAVALIMAARSLFLSSGKLTISDLLAAVEGAKVLIDEETLQTLSASEEGGSHQYRQLQGLHSHMKYCFPGTLWESRSSFLAFACHGRLAKC